MTTALPRSIPSKTDGRSAKHPLLATLFFLAAFGLPLSFLVTPVIGGSVSNFTEAATPLLTLVLAVARLSAIIYSGKTPILASTLWMFVYITAAVVPLAQIETNTFNFLVGPQYLPTASMIFLVAVIAYEAGRFFDRGFDSRPTPTDLRSVSTTRLKWLTFLALLPTAYYVQSVGGVGSLLQSRTELNQSLALTSTAGADSQVFSALTMSFGTIPIFLAAVLWLSYLRRNRVRALGPWVWLLVLVAANIVNNPFANPRYWVLTIIIATFFAMPRLSARRVQFAIIGGLVAALVAFPYSDYFFRYASEYRGALRLAPVAETIAGKDFDQWTMTANGVWWVAANGFTMGRQILGAIFFWVPRSVWPDKARDTGVEIGTAIGYSNVNLSSPLPLEFWVDFGWIGVVIGFVILGLGSRRLDRLFTASRDGARSTILLVDIWVPVLAGYTFILMRGPLLQSMGRLFVIALVLTLIIGPRVRLDGSENPSGPSKRRALVRSRP